MKERRELVAALTELVHAPEQMLGRVFIEADHRRMTYTVRDHDGSVLLEVPHEALVEGESIDQAIMGILHSLVCALCDAVLVDGESGLCATCEGHVVMDLLRMRHTFL